MGSCNNCHKKILYNKYKRYRKEILCLECYNTRLERKAAAIAERKRLVELATEIVKPSKKARKRAKKKGVTIEDKISEIYGGDKYEEGEAPKDSE